MVSFAEAAQAWPDLDLSESVFAAYLAARPGGTHGSDLYLACACMEKIDGALAAFERVFLAKVELFLARHRLPSGALDDLKQQLRERLFVDGRIADYSGQGSLANWLRVVAVRAAIDFQRKRTESLLADRSGVDPVADLVAPGEPELDFVKETYRGAIARAFKRSLSELASEQRNVLHLHFVDGLTLDELAGLFHVHRATIARRIAAAREAVLDEARRWFCEQAKVAPAEADSLFALVRSRLDLTLSSFLGRS